MKGTKIICTLGANTATKEMITNLSKIGMNVVRLNMSHGNLEEHLKTVKLVREVEAEQKVAIAVAFDTQGPELRIKVNNDSMLVKKGAIVKFTNVFEDEGVYINFQNFSALQENMKILVNDGAAKFIIKKVESNFLEAQSLNDCKLESVKGMNIPGASLGLPILTEHDKECIKRGIENEIDFIFASFISSSDDYKTVKNFITEHNGNQEIISKIESKSAMDCLEEIIDESDGLMIARGDLCVEIGYAELFTAQKIISKLCVFKDKILICATQMMESMILNASPTRAEICDVGNAVLDGCDCVMLSGETAIGKYPIETVEIMSEICENAEKFLQKSCKLPISESYLLEDVEIEAVDKIRRKFPNSIIFVVAQNLQVLRKICIRKNVFGIFKENFDKKLTEEFYKISIKKIKLCEDGERIENVEDTKVDGIVDDEEVLNVDEDETVINEVDVKFEAVD